MYKHTYTSVSKRYLLNGKIRSYISEGIDNLMKTIELSLIYNSYPNIESKNNVNIEFKDFKALRKGMSIELIKERIKRLDKKEIENIFYLKEIESKRLLISLYEYYLREEMVEYIDFFDFDKGNSTNARKISEKFRDFIKNNNQNYLEDFDIEIKELFKDNKSIRKIYINRPTYFLLYRIRNNLLRETKITKCSEYFIKSSIQKIRRFYSEKYINEYNKDFFLSIKEIDKMKKKVFNHIEESFLDCIKNGKTISVGNELVANFKNAIKDDKDYINLKNEYVNLIKIEDGYEITKKKYENFLEIYNSIALKYFDNKTEINTSWIKNDLNMFFSYCIAEYIVDSLPDDKIQNIDKCKIKEIENQTIDYIKNQILKTETYNVFMKIENIDLKQLNIIKVSDLTFIKGKELKVNMNKYLQFESTEFEKRFFNLNNIQENDVYVKVEKIKAYKNDSEFISNVVLNKINDIINVIYFCTARDDSKIYKLGNQMIIIGSGNNKLVKYLNNEGKIDIPLFSNEWIDKTFTEYSKYTKLIIESIKEFNKIVSDNTLDNELMIESNRKLLNEIDVYSLSRDMAVLIAGTNIFKYNNVSYLELRFWLIEDYIEFFNEELPKDQFIKERFQNFYKRVINIILSYSDLKRNNLIKDLQNWILKIFPNDYKYKEDSNNE